MRSAKEESDANWWGPHGRAAFSGVHTARHVVGRGVLLDVAAAKGLDRLPGDHAVIPEDLDEAAEFGRVTVRAGDLVLVWTGQIRLYLAGDRHGYAFPSPGLSIRTPEWFHARDVAAVANGTLTFEIFPPEIEDLWLGVHALHLVEMGMLQGQDWNLEELSTACAQEGRYAFLLSAMLEPFVGGTGTPVAPGALFRGDAEKAHGGRPRDAGRVSRGPEGTRGEFHGWRRARTRPEHGTDRRHPATTRTCRGRTALGSPRHESLTLEWAKRNEPSTAHPSG